MHVRRVPYDNDVVRSVVGVAQMVAVVVVLASVTSSFVLGLGEQVSQPPPQEGFTFDFHSGDAVEDDFGNTGGDGVLVISYDGEEPLEADTLAVRGSTVSGGTWAAAGPSYAGSDLAAGDSIAVRVDHADSIRITWTPEAGSEPATLRVWHGPDA